MHAQRDMPHTLQVRVSERAYSALQDDGFAEEGGGRAGEWMCGTPVAAVCHALCRSTAV
jgi:hypothetical protein